MRLPDMIEIKLEDRGVLAALALLQESLDDLSPVMRAVSGVFADATERAFRDERDPASGASWPALRPVTIRMREKEGKWPGKILQKTSGGLAPSILPEYGSTYALVGTNKRYAATHQFGAAKGAYGRTKRGAPIPWGDIPPRPFLGFSEDDRTEILEIVFGYLNGSRK